MSNYWITAVIKGVAALASVGTGIYLFKLRRDTEAVSLAAKLTEQEELDLALKKSLEAQEKLLHEIEFQKNRFEIVMKQMPAAVIIAEAPSGKIIFANEKMEEVWGHGLILSRSVDEYKKWIGFHSNGTQYEGSDWPLARSIQNGEIVINEDTQILRGDGKKAIIRLSSAPVRDRDGKIVAGVVICQDVTQMIQMQNLLKESESELRAYAEAMPQMAFIADAAGNIIFFNRRHYDYFGVQYGETESWGWKDRGIIHLEDLPKTVQVWTESVQSGKPYEVEYRLRRYDGAYRWHLGRAVAVKDEKGNVTRWFGTNTDIHDQKEARNRLEEAILARDEFLSIASHELRTPLSSLKLQNQIVKRRIQKGDTSALLPESINRLVDQTDRQVNRLAALIDDMLDVARIRTGKINLKLEGFDLCDLLKEVIDRMKLQMIQAQTPPHLEVCESVNGVWDRSRMDQVIANLLTNAIRYGNRKPVYISIRRNNGKVLLSFKDKGVGVLKENRERIFNRFERAISANEVSGLGLGLFIVRRLVEIHGGRVWVESEGLNLGSTFYVELPVIATKRLDIPGRNVG